MTVRPFAALLALGVLLPGRAAALPPPPLPHCGPSPLLYVRFLAPAGTQVTFYQGSPQGRTFPTPTTVGLRPGYFYRVQLSGFEDAPALSLYPTLEVIGSLKIPPRQRSADYPAPVVFTSEDIHRARAGSLVTKVVLLEAPETASPVATQPNQPLELEIPANRDLLQEARARGRPMVIIRLGQRQGDPEELAHAAVPGTMLLPGDKLLPPAACPPSIAWAGTQLHDPFIGPKPLEEECLHDGGDALYPLGLDNLGRLGGLDPGDTAAEYTNSCGERRVVTSNRVCLCVPRYLIVRSEITPAGYDMVLGVEDRNAVCVQNQLRARQPSLQALQNAQLEALHSRKRPTSTVVVQPLDQLGKICVLNAVLLEIGPFDVLGTCQMRLLKADQLVRLKRQMELAAELSRPIGVAAVQEAVGPAVVGRVEGVVVVSGALETREVKVCCHEEPCPPDKPLVLFKWVNTCQAQVGDVVTFYLKYSNHGGKPITDVAVSDSLTGRLEYVPHSARSSRDAVFTAQENPSGSLVLRWEISGRLLPGDSGVVSFQARVR